MNIETIVTMSNRYGSKPELVLAGGGNTSMKTESTIFVKASGTALSTITRSGFVEMSRNGLAKVFKKEYPKDDKVREAAVLEDLMHARIDPKAAGRPSVETLLHSLFVHTFVLHIHPAIVNGLTCSRNGEHAAKMLFREKVIWIESCRPGYTLALLCRDQLEQYKKRMGTDAQIVFLQNHGVFFSADTVEEMDSLVGTVLDALEAAVIEKPDFSECLYNAEEAAHLSKVIGSLSSEYTHVIFNESCVEKRFWVSEERIQSLMKPFTPDQIVYCKAHPLYIEEVALLNSEFLKYIEHYGYLPRIIMVKGVGFFSVAADERTAKLAELLFCDAIKIAVYARSFGGVLPMSEDLVNFIENWEAESYRQNQNS